MVCLLLQKAPTHIRGYVKAFITRAHEIHAYYRSFSGVLDHLYITPSDHDVLSGELEDLRNEIGDIVCILYLLFEEQELEITDHHRRRLQKIIAKLEAAKCFCTDLIHRIENDVMLVSIGDRLCGAYDEIPYTIDKSVIYQEFKQGYTQN